ncbi:MAG: glycosyltransferase [Pseudoalteromonas sp.]|nr:glycosyltransferase [Pseudoalteromonas sp.]
MFVLTEKQLREYSVLRGFDIDFSEYVIANAIEGECPDPLYHYVTNWRDRNLVIPNEFNTYEYLYGAKDVLISNENPLLHYLTVGIHEGRSPQLFEEMGDDSFYAIHDSLMNSDIGETANIISLTRSQLDCYVDFYSNSIKFNSVWEKVTGEDTKDGLLAIILKYDLDTSDFELGEKLLIEKLEEYDLYQDKTTELSSLSNVVNTGDLKLVVTSASNPDYDDLITLGLDWSEFYESNGLESSIDPITFYVQNWKGSELKLQDFHTKFYLDTYPDVANSGINPLLHYFSVGKNEGRIGSFQSIIDRHYRTGDSEYDHLLPTLVIVSHESSATGAPLVGLNLGLSLKDDFNIVHIILHESKLQEEFVSSSVFTLTNLKNKHIENKVLMNWLYETFHPEAIICNSVETHEILEVVSKFKSPVITLLHEFSEYTRPRGKITNAIIKSQRVIVPAKIIADSAFKEMYKYADIKNFPQNVTILPQGKLPFTPQNNGTNLSINELKKKFNIKENDKVVVGAGYVQTRKGVDLFIEAAYKIKQRFKGSCKFIWVGGGYDSDWDVTCSVWLESQLEEFDLQSEFNFLSHQKSLDIVFELADVYLLTSRLDPFPNVVIDALQADLPVICFDRTTGFAEFLTHHKSHSAVVPFLDTTEMANKTISFLKKNNYMVGVNNKLVADNLSFKNYVSELLCIIGDVRKEIESREYIEKVIADSGLFNHNFYNKGDDEKEAIAYYVQTALNGIHSLSPTPGFSVGKWFEVNKNTSKYVVPLYEQLRSGNSIYTHECIELTGGKKYPTRKKIAVHLHLYYIDLASDFNAYFSCLPEGFDLFITVCDRNIEKQVAAIFSTCGAKNIEVVFVENIGRDVAPFFDSLKNQVFHNEYDIVGHFHSKKSNDVDQGTGDRWRKYLLENLIGSEEAVTEIFQLFNDPNIGLVFAEDAHNIDYGKNKSFGDELCDAMEIERLNNATLFPLGTMFWTKPEALGPLFELNFDDYLEAEPLPYDGSYMHATERLVAHVAIQNGYQIKTVYAQGTNW